MPRRRKAVDDGEQQDIEGTRVYNRAVEAPVKKYVEALQQRQAWQVDENNLRARAIEAMEEADVMVYYLKTGHKVELVSKGNKLKTTAPKDEDGKAEKADRQTKLEVTEVG
jgi:hypothetical protein